MFTITFTRPSKFVSVRVCLPRHIAFRAVGVCLCPSVSVYVSSQCFHD